MKLVFASNNLGKIKEIKQLVLGSQIEIIPQSEFNVPEAEESATTFVENALLKARQATALTHLPAIADDSGLVVPGLGGEPGVFSARYAGKGVTMQKHIEKLLNQIEINAVSRDAYYYCVIVLLRQKNDPCPIICEGKWQGKILTAPIGSEGFGYDPIFYDETYRCSAAELPAEIKNQISHRGQAMKKLIQSIIRLGDEGFVDLNKP